VPSATPAPRVPVEERLFSLVLALLATDAGLTKAEILSTVQGYRQRYNHSGDNANLERQFERDKDDIRELGVPLETLESPGQAGNNQSLRYRIPKGSYDLPADVRFTPEETALLGLASVVWQEGSISGESRRALVKLRSLGVTGGEPVLAYLPRIRMRDEGFEPLSSAIDKYQVVRFEYLKPGQESAVERVVQPLALFSHEGRWHLYALEPGTGWNKTFLLRRIVSDVTPTGKVFEPPAGDQAAIGLAEIEEVWDERVAVVEVEAGSDAEARLAKRRGASRLSDGNLELHTADFHILADELAGFGPEVLVISPSLLREGVRARLERIAADHG
jgi:proteasome accessory factor B